MSQIYHKLHYLFHFLQFHFNPFICLLPTIRNTHYRCSTHKRVPKWETYQYKYKAGYGVEDAPKECPQSQEMDEEYTSAESSGQGKGEWQQQGGQVQR